MAEETPKKPPLVEMAGVSSEDIAASFSDELRLPSDKILSTRGAGDPLIYEKVLADWQCKSTFSQLRLAIVSREWNVDPGGEETRDVEAAEDLKRQLGRIGWDEVSRKMLMGVWFGYSVGELMLRADGTRIELDQIRVRKSRRFRFDRNGGLRLLTQTNRNPGQLMPDNKFWIFRAGAEDDDDPYGLGLGHYCYWPVFLKRGGIRFWALFAERFAKGTIVGQVPPGATEDDRAKVEKALHVLSNGGQIVISDNVSAEIVQAARSAGGDYHAWCQYLDEAISKIVLSQTMTTDDGSSRSQAEVHGGVKLEVVKSFGDLLCESFNAGPAAWLTAWNHPGAKPPRVWRDFSEATDLDREAKRDKTLHDMGWAPSEDRIVETYGPGYERHGRGAQPPGAPAPPGVAFAEGDSLSADDVVEMATDGDAWRPLMTPEVEALEALAEESRDLEELRDRLGELARRNPDTVTESLARVMFASSVAGQTGVDLDGDLDDD